MRKSVKPGAKYKAPPGMPAMKVKPGAPAAKGRKSHAVKAKEIEDTLGDTKF